MRLTPHNRRPSTYNTLLLTFIAIISAGLVSTFFLSQSFKEKTVSELAETQARQQAEIIFRTIWYGMLQGWSRPQIDSFIHSLDMNTDHSQVQLVRAPVIDALFGPHIPSQRALQADTRIQAVMNSKQTSIYSASGYIRYLYPITAEESCLSCHSNSAIGKVHGILDIRFPDNQVQASLSYTLNFYTSAIVILLLVLFLALFVIIRKRVVHPMRDLSKKIRQSIKDDLSVARIEPEQYLLKEPYTLANSFNQLAMELEEYHRQLRESSWLDSLTGLYNRRYFTEQMPALLSKARHDEQPCALMLIDLDKFKPINDELGHDAGDMALVYFSRVLQQEIKGSDLVIRLGGDEFVILLTNTHLAGILAVRKRIEEHLSVQPANLGKGVRYLQASIGYAVFPDDATDTETLLQQADESMYSQKRLKKVQRSA